VIGIIFIGLDQLKQSYVNTLLIQHSLSHYIDIINQKLKDNTIDTNIEDSIFNSVNELTNLEIKLKNIWCKSEINVINNLLLLLKDIDVDNNHYIVNAINIILDGKDAETNQIITIHATSL
jgi:hypothetical protein